MYNVGFGDCFLIRIPAKGGERRMLIDCGYHSQGKGKFTDKTLVQQIEEDLDGQPLHVVVATHRHQDHISGFGESQMWKKIDVHEVWLPFTANPGAVRGDPSLRAWHALMDSAASHLGADGRLTDEARNALGARSSMEQAEVEFLLWNARANAPGIENLLTGMSRRDGGLTRRVFFPKDGSAFPSKYETSELPGVTVHILGPPRDPSLRKSKRVPASWGVRALAGPAPAGDDLGAPFGRDWQIASHRLPGRRPFQDRTLRSMMRFNDDLFRAAHAVEGFLNGESLVLVLEFKTARLLLPGDAEVGTWTAILETPEALAIAQSATFLKVGHHGSHNASPLNFVNGLAARTPAVISTQKGPGNFRNNIPFQPLLKALEARHLRHVRTDEGVKPVKGLFKQDPEKRWIDCTIPC